MLFVRQLNSPYLWNWSWRRNIQPFSYLVFQQLFNQWIFVLCAVLNGQGWAQTHSADNWLSMQNLHQDFISSFPMSPNSEMSVCLSLSVMMVTKENGVYFVCMFVSLTST